MNRYGNSSWRTHEERHVLDRYRASSPEERDAKLASLVADLIAVGEDPESRKSGPRT